MSLRGIESRIAKLEEARIQRAACNYRFYRDDISNLNIEFENGKIITLPLFRFRPYQLETQHKLFVDNIKRFFLVRPRRSGKEVESWNLLCQAAIESPGLYLMIYPTNVRARIILWEGAISYPDGTSLKFLKMIPPEFVAKVNNQDMSIDLINGSIIRVIGSDIDPDKLRGVNVRGAVFSEYAFSDPRVLHILMPVFRQNNGWFILQTTFNGMNHAYRYMQEIKGNPAWYCRVDTVESLVDEQGNRYITDEMIEEDRRSGMPEFMIQQEYYSVVQLNQESLYFAHEVNMLMSEERLVPDLRLPSKRVYMFLDIGMNDKTAVTLAQIDNNYQPVIIDYMENNNRAFEYYIRWAEATCARHGLMLSSIFVPHDGQKRDFNTGKNTVDFGQDLGYRVIVVPKPTSKFNAIQSMRRMLYRCRFNKETTTRLVECLSNYSKEFDIKNGIYKDAPLHNWASHGVDSFQTLTLAIEGHLISERSVDVVYINPR
jgi:phage terminase large subunit